MNRTRLMLFVALLCSGTAAAQSTHLVKGWVRDSTGTVLPGASIRLATPHDTLSTVTRDDGSFEIARVKELHFRILVYMMSYNNLQRDFSISPTDSVARLDTLILGSHAHQLGGITVKAPGLAVSIREDTVEYTAASYKVRDGSMVGEVVKRLPGVEVDHTGKVTAQGKAVTKIRVNGKDFFGGDINKALKNLPADIIDKLQVIDDYGDQATLTGIKTGEPNKIINLTLKPDKQNGAFGAATIAGGTSSRYLGTANINRFQGERQISLVGDMNNTNTGAFSFGDNGGISGADGTTLTHSYGLNYREKFSNKVMGYGSYNYSDSKSVVSGITDQQTVDTNYININNQVNTSTSHGKSHQFDYNVEYKIDTLNFLKISPNISWNESTSQTSSDFHVVQANLHPVKTSDGTSLSDNNTKSPTVNANLMFNHRFLKRGRNLNISGNYMHSNSNALQDTKTITHIGYADSVNVDTTLHQQVDNRNGNDNINARLSYTEPIDSFSMIEFNYSISQSSSNTLRDTWNIDPSLIKTRVDSQSNRYDYQFMTQRIGLNYNLHGKKNHLTIGITGQPVLLTGTSTQPDFSTRKSAFNLIPSARYSYNFSTNQTLSLNYNGSSSQPGFMQLMPVTDLTNPQYPVVGNPDLKPEFSQQVSIQYRKFDVKKGNTFFVNISGSEAQQRIVTNILNDSAHLAHMSNTVIQETRYLNTNGAYMANGYYSYSQPFFDRKLTASITGGFNYNNNISYINDVRQLGKNYVWNQGAKIRVALPDIIEAEFTGTYTSNKTRYDSRPGFNSDANSTILELYGKNFIGKHMIIGYNASKTFNSGFSSGVSANPAIVNLYLECQLLKGNKAAIRFEGFDLFNENTGVYHSVNGPVITDTRNNRLSRYFLLSFSYRLQKFGF